jgi:hypothetical protein
MDLPDQEIVRALLARDGRLRFTSHRAEGGCRFADLYEDEPCPWCLAEDRRGRPAAKAPSGDH